MWGLFFPIGFFWIFFSLYSDVDPCRVVAVDILASVELEGIFRGISSRVFFYQGRSAIARWLVYDCDSLSLTQWSGRAEGRFSLALGLD